MRSLFRIAIVAIVALLFVAGDLYAQNGLGLSYERRSDTPTNGFGLQLEREILKSVPVINVRARLHASYFSEESNLTLGGVQLGQQTVTSYDFGAALLGGVGLGLFRPYAGVGIGYEDFDFEDSSENTSYFYGIAGIAITPIPFIKPYLEYRLASYNSISEARKEIGEGPGRLHIGITLSF